MPRALLAYPLILALAVGPVLCCCTAGRVLGSSAPAPTNAQQPVPASKPVASGHSCCAHKHKKQQPASPKPAPSKPGQCPCKEGASKVQATPTPASVADQLDSSWPASKDFLASTSGLDGLTPLAEGVSRSCRGPSSLFPSVSDLLFSHHRLRC
jgi:hypothetical protein